MRGEGALELLSSTCDERIDLAAKADAEGCIEERRHEREAGGDQADEWDARGEPDGAHRGEHEAHQLGELQRRHRLLLGDRSEAGCDEAAEQQAVGMLTGPTPGADREDDGLRAQNDGGGDRADGRRQQRRDDHDGGGPRREPRTANVHLVRCAGVRAGRHGCAPVAREGLGWGRTTKGRSRVRRERKARLLSSYNNNSNNPRRGTDRLRGAW